MTSIFHTLNIGSQALFANRQGLDTAAHNIANAQTEGYSRQTMQLGQRLPTPYQGVFIGNGVYTQDISRAHDRFIEKQLNQSNSSLGASNTREEALRSLEGIYSPEQSASLYDEITSFFSTLHTLANFPEELPCRVAVVEQGKSLAGTFRRVDENLRATRSMIDVNIESSVHELNSLLDRISGLNGKIKGLEFADGSQANDLRDQRDRMLRQVSEIFNVSYYDDSSGMVAIRGPNEVLLVEGNRAATVQLQRSSITEGAFQLVTKDSEGGGAHDITHAIKNGKIGGFLEVRDEVITGLIHNNNVLAKSFTDEFNEIHRSGYGINSHGDKTGLNFFKPVGDLHTAAENMDLDDAIIASTDALSTASLSKSPGDNINITRMLGLQGEKVLNEGKSTFEDFYTNTVGVLGTQILKAGHVKESDQVLHSDIVARREAVAGVSLDEEATNMIRWQSSFTAASKVIKTVDEMLDTILHLK